MKPYEKYKSSGIEWLGVIPEHWEVKRVKEIFRRIGSGTTPPSGDPTYYDENGFNWLQTGDLNDGLISETSKKISQKAVDEISTLKKYPINSLVIAMYGATIGKMGYLRIKTTTNQACCVLTNPLNNNSQYLFYLLLSIKQYIISLSTGGGQPNINQDIVRFLKLYIPTLQEQTSIAIYLDTKTAAIDRKIELLTAKSDKYKALRRSLINETVCRGLNPDAPKKDSGIEWIGMIPEHWCEYRMKDLGSLYSGLSGKAGDDFNQDENDNNCDFIPFTNIFNNDTIDPDVMGKVVVFENEKQNKVKKNDLFFLMSSEDYDGLGKSSLLTVDLKNTYLNSFCKGFRITRKKVLPAFLNYQLQSDTFRKIMQIEGKGFTRMNLKMEKVNDFTIYIPDSIEEQATIVKYLNERNAQIDTILTNINEQITKLTLLRKTLINDVVTGKIKVTED